MTVVGPLRLSWSANTLFPTTLEPRTPHTAVRPFVTANICVLRVVEKQVTRFQQVNKPRCLMFPKDSYLVSFCVRLALFSRTLSDTLPHRHAWFSVTTESRSAIVRKLASARSLRALVWNRQTYFSTWLCLYGPTEMLGAG